jgi:hypothetical protein
LLIDTLDISAEKIDLSTRERIEKWKVEVEEALLEKKVRRYHFICYEFSGSFEPAKMLGCMLLFVLL